MDSLKTCQKLIAGTLEKIYDRREAGNISFLLLEDVYGFSRTEVLANVPAVFEKGALDPLLSRLLSHEPVQYVTGLADFLGRKYRVRPGGFNTTP